MFTILKDNKEKVQMLLAAVLLYCLWHFGYEMYLAKETRFDWILNRVLGMQTATWFTVFGAYDARVVNYSIYPHLMYLNGLPIISIDTPCNGLPMMYLFLSFIVVYPGPWKRKLAFILTGVAIIYILNLFRIIALSYISIYMKDYFYFNHKYAFQIIVYTVIILLWMYWIVYGRDRSIGWAKGFMDFIRFKFVSRLLQII
jgi:exosortase family protein XrtF